MADIQMCNCGRFRIGEIPVAHPRAYCEAATPSASVDRAEGAPTRKDGDSVGAEFSSGLGAVDGPEDAATAIEKAHEDRDYEVGNATHDVGNAAWEWDEVAARQRVFILRQNDADEGLTAWTPEGMRVLVRTLLNDLDHLLSRGSAFIDDGFLKAARYVGKSFIAALRLLQANGGGSTYDHQRAVEFLAMVDAMDSQGNADG